MTEPEGREIQELEKISAELQQINVNTGSAWTALLRGGLSGAGAIVGGIVAVVLVGWVLGLLGIIPGLNVIAAYFSDAAKNIRY